MIEKEIKLEQFAVYDIISQMEHSNLKQITIKQIVDSNAVITEEYIKGQTLSKVLKAGELTSQKAISYGLQLASAIEVLHMKNIIHRDIKPDNIVIETTGVLKLIDYDIARIFNPDKSRDTTLLGTVGYAPPEQFGFSQSDCRTDIYSFGVVLQEINKQIDLGLDSIIAKACELDPQHRYNTISEMRVEMLENLPLVREEYIYVEKIVETEGAKSNREEFTNLDNTKLSNLKLLLHPVDLFENHYGKLKIINVIELLFYFLTMSAMISVNHDEFLAAQGGIVAKIIWIMISLFTLVTTIELFNRYTWNFKRRRWSYFILINMILALAYEGIVNL